MIEYESIECMLGFAFLPKDNYSYRDIITWQEYHGISISKLDVYIQRYNERKRKESK